jgi:hypothetical protein
VAQKVLHYVAAAQHIAYRQGSRRPANILDGARRRW